MAAGEGFKTWQTGDVLTAADVNGYLMQGVWVFDDAADRTAQVTSPAEGNFSYLKDIDALEVYDGSAWVSAGGGGATAVNPNLIINGSFAINQREYASAANLASGAYGLDRWQSQFTNTTLTFTAAPNGQQVTINQDGVIRQTIERANVAAGSYVLSWSGTATGRIYNSGGSTPSYASSPVTFSADGTANVVVEFTATGGTKTLSNVKLEIGSTPTTFVLAGGTIEGELSACQRYYVREKAQTTFQPFAQGNANSGTQHYVVYKLPTTMRTAPSAVEFSTLQCGRFGGSAQAVSALTIAEKGTDQVLLEATSGNTSLSAGAFVNLGASNSTSAYIGFTAEF